MACLSNTVARRVLLVGSALSDTSLRGIARFAQKNDWSVSTDVARVVTVTAGWSGDGVLVSLPQPADCLARLTASGLPCVTFSETSEAVALPLVAPDEAEIGRLAADHLLERSHRRFACAPFIDLPECGDRLSAFQARLAEHGCSCHELPPAYTRQGAPWHEDAGARRRALVHELRQLVRPSAVFAFNDSIAAEVVEACRDAGLSVPEDVAVLGVGNSIFSTTAAVPLSSVDLDSEAIGWRAASVLEEAMNGRALGGVFVPVRPKGVVTRVSTDVIAVADPRVARALSYIAENYPDSDLNVEVVARSVGMSRRGLERAFRQATGRTIHEHVNNVRMREASRLLAASPRTRASDVAALVGLPGERTFFRVFRRHFGMSPKAHQKWTTQARVAEAKTGGQLRPLVATALESHALAPGADFTAA